MTQVVRGRFQGEWLTARGAGILDGRAGARLAERIARSLVLGAGRIAERRGG